MRIGLVVVFNHAYDANLARLDALYAHRFSSIHYLVPFYRGDRHDVSPTYQSSYTFQGYFAEGFPAIIASKCDHYLFIADDLLLREDLDERTLPETLRINHRTGYIKQLIPLAKTRPDWTHALAALRSLKRNRFVEFDSHLPTRAAAESHLRQAKIEVSSMSMWNLASRLMASWRHDRKADVLDNVIYALYHHRRGSPRLPLLASYSDFVAVPSCAMSAFCNLAGVMAAMGMFAEVAIPTALALSCDCVHTEVDISRRGREIWDAATSNALLATHHFELSGLLSGMSPELLYIHPVKLSRLH